MHASFDDPLDSCPSDQSHKTRTVPHCNSSAGCGRSWRQSAQLACLAVVVLFSIPLNLTTPLPLTLAVDSVIGDRPLPHVLQSWLPPDVRSSTSSLLLFLCIAYVGIALCIRLQSLTLWLLSSYTGDGSSMPSVIVSSNICSGFVRPTTGRMDRQIPSSAFSMMPHR